MAFSLVLGVVAAVLVWGYMQQVQREAQAKIATKPVETTAVVVAAQDIPPRTTITASMVQVQQLPVTAKHANAYTSIKDVEGKVTKLYITTGEQVISNKFAVQREEAGLTFIIPPGKRAVSVTTSEHIGAGGLILPGDLIDIIAIFDAKTLGKDMAEYILQRVEVLAVAQAVQGEVETEDKGPIQQAGEQITAQPTPVPKTAPKPQPQAKTITLALTPEEVQRLVLAEARGDLRLVLRPAKEGTIVDLPPALLSTIRTPLEASEALITAAEISPTNARVGDTLTVRIQVKNTSTGVLRTQDPKPEFVYVQGQTFHSQNFPSVNGAFRVGLNTDAQSPVPFPYRWGLGSDLQPGATTTITGYVKLTYDMKATNFWAGLIKEPATVVQDNVATTLVTVVPTNVAVVAVDVANVRSGPSVDSSIIAQLEYGAQVPILGQQADWYKVKLPDGREGWMAAGWIVGASGR